MKPKPSKRERLAPSEPAPAPESLITIAQAADLINMPESKGNRPRDSRNRRTIRLLRKLGCEIIGRSHKYTTVAAVKKALPLLFEPAPEPKTEITDALQIAVKDLHARLNELSKYTRARNGEVKQSLEYLTRNVNYLRRIIEEQSANVSTRPNPSTDQNDQSRKPQ